MTTQQQSSSQAGFTLVELLVTTAITAMILLTASTMLMTFFLSNTRTTYRRQIKAEGERALAAMEFAARQGSECTNDSATGFTIISPGGGNPTIFRVNSNKLEEDKGTGAGFQTLTTDFVVPQGSASFDCAEEDGREYITIEFRLAPEDGSTIYETFRTVVFLRNST